MRLLQLQDDGTLSLVEFLGDKIPCYAILSHTWGADNEEVTFQDIVNGTGESKAGYNKIHFCRKQAKQDGLQFLWIDTCCIDKSSSQELSEAINSMFRWYKKAERCYVYLSDVSDSVSGEHGECTKRWKSAFKRSRWFTRGWTLQELIAPASVVFFSKEGTYLGNKESLEQTLHDVTGIALEALRGTPLTRFSTDERFRWASERETKREEDATYCLLGIFDIQMPLLYGEGREKASNRLRKEIRETSSTEVWSLNEEKKQMLLDSLRFDQIDARQMTIKTAHAKTCRWLLRKSEYLNWLNTDRLNEHHGFLWIRGKPGTGKSTLMKFALTHARRTMKDRIIISFFFNARGEDLEKSTIGTYRSLLLQLLEPLPVLRNVFDSLSSASRINADYQWTIESLKLLLEQAIQRLDNSAVVCFIDALDECDEDQIRDMMQFFEHASELAVSNGVRFQICFSSRHYPHITIQKGLNLVLEGQEGHTQDIANYLESELKIGPRQSKTAQKIRSQLQEKASNVFMWVVLVVGILNKEYDRGRVYKLQQRLKEIPSDLHDLFRDILTRDSHDRDELVLCIQWMLFAEQPLSPEQLYFAVISGVRPDVLSRWDPDEVTSDVVKNFILNSSKGFVEVTPKLQRVQFIHESVRDFLLKENGLSNIWPDLRSNLQGQSHEQLKQCCLNYTNMDILDYLDISESLPKASSQQAADLRKTATDQFPFLEYAVRNVLHHAEKAEGGGVTQAGFLSIFPLAHWTKLHNLLEKFQVRRYTGDVTSLYVLAERNLSNLIRIHPSISSCLEVGNERYGPPLFAAFATESWKATGVFIETLAANTPTGSDSERLYDDYFQDEGHQRSFGYDFKFSRKRGILSHAAELGDNLVFALLLGMGYSNINSFEASGRTPLIWAAECGHSAIVKMLVDKGADVNALGGKYRNALQAASLKCDEETVKLLLNKGADVNVQGGEYGNALQAGLCRGRDSFEGDTEKIVKSLLDRGADINAQGGFYVNALQAAAAKGHKEIVELLLDRGADINAQGGFYGNTLQAAAAKGHKEIVELLLDRGADINAQSEFYGNALQTATAEGHKEIVELLLDRGADINAQSGDYSNALRAAVVQGYKEIVELLLDRGANINAQGGFYGNTLQAAAVKGYKEIVELLLDRGANINAQGGDYGNALQAAAVKGYKEIVELLLDRGADINAQSGDYSNALRAAVVQGYKEIVELLLDRGATINTQGGFYGNTLQAAAVKGYKEIVELLLDRGATINTRGGFYGNALQAAAVKGYKEIVELLLDRGANINAQGGHYSNAL